MTHLKRAGILLVVILVAAFVVPRVIPVPEELEPYGFHKVNAEANNEAWASLPLQYAGEQACSDCHDIQYTMWQQADHSPVSCETCHSPAYQHVTGGPPPVIDRSPDLCALCHDDLVSRPEDFPQVDVSVHGGGETCITCHNPHAPREFLPPTLPHQLEGWENCQSCHSPTEPLDILPPPVMHTLEGRENCVECHSPDWVQPEEPIRIPQIPHTVEGRENCLVCHDTDGIVPYPPNHLGRTVESCRTCHKPVSGPAAEPTVPPATSPPTTAPPPTGEPGNAPEVPHQIEGRENCLVCHDTGKFRPFPDNHSGRSVESCLTCHSVDDDD